MAAYNRINGVYATQNRWLLTEVLREEWGFDGLVMSDWGAVDDRVAALAAGLDLEMPPSGTDEQIVAAVQDGRLDPRAVAAAAGRLLRLRDRLNRADRAGGLDENTHHELAREAARAGAVLLKNDGDLLPIDPAAQQRVAVIGEFARTPRYQGHGSSRVEPTRVDDAWTALRQGAGPDLELVFAPGFLLDGSPSAALLDEAVEAATAADLVLVFLGLPEGAETEGKDRADIELPPAQIELLRAVGAACSQVVVVLSNGGVVALTDWQDHAQAVLETWLGGQAGGSAVVDLLYGVHSPSGKLTESIPLRLQDVPSYLHYPGRDGHSVYGEGRYVGYRYYDTLNLPVAYPFGHGLSYTTFDYRDLRVEETGDHSWTVRASIVNTGSRFGEEVVQLYVAFAEPYPTRPHHELRGFTKIGLAPGDSGQVEFRLTGRDLAWYSTKRRGWRIDPGTFTVELGASSRDIRLWARLHTPGDGVRDKPTPESTLSEWLDHPTGGKLLREHLAARPGAVSLGDLDQVTLDAVSQIPLTKFHSTLGLSTEAMDALVAAVRES
jgi:beta-glucosidase